MTSLDRFARKRPRYAMLVKAVSGEQGSYRDAGRTHYLSAMTGRLIR